MAITEYNVDLDVKGRVLATTVPNSTGSIVTWNSSTNVFGLRTNAQIITDLGLATQAWANAQGWITTASVGNGNISYTGTGSITGGGTSTANQAGNTNFTFDLTPATKTGIAQGQTAFGWGRGLRVDGNGVPTGAATISGTIDAVRNASMYASSSASGKPGGLVNEDVTIVNFTSGNANISGIERYSGFDLVSSATTDQMWFRRENMAAGKSPWLEFIHSGNIGSYIPTALDFVTTNTTQTGLSGDKTWTGVHRFNNNQFFRGILSTTTSSNGINIADYLGATTGIQNRSFNNYLSGNTITEALDIRQANGGSMVYPLHISGTGNSGNNRGTGIQFNVGHSSTSHTSKPLLRLSANPLSNVGNFIVSNYDLATETWTDRFTVNNSGAYYGADILSTQSWTNSNFHKLAKNNAEAISASYYANINNEINNYLGNVSLYSASGTIGGVARAATHIVSYGLNAQYGFQLLVPSATTNPMTIRKRINNVWSEETFAYQSWVTTQIASAIPNVTGFVPYTGATTNVNLNNKQLTNVNNLQLNQQTATSTFLQLPTNSVNDLYVFDQTSYTNAPFGSLFYQKGKLMMKVAERISGNSSVFSNGFLGTYNSSSNTEYTSNTLLMNLYGLGYDSKGAINQSYNFNDNLKYNNTATALNIIGYQYGNKLLDVNNNSSATTFVGFHPEMYEGMHIGATNNFTNFEIYVDRVGQIFARKIRAYQNNSTGVNNQWNMFYSDDNSNKTTIDWNANTLNANIIKKVGGTASQFLKADGSVDSNIYALASSIVTPNNGLLTITTSADLTGGGTFSANQSTASNVSIGLGATVLSNIQLGVTANSWGNHATVGYLTATSLVGYATETWANGRFSLLGHTHPISEVIGLQNALDGKANTNGSNLTNIANWQSALGINTSWNLQQVTDNGNTTTNNINFTINNRGILFNGWKALEGYINNTILSANGDSIYLRPNGSASSAGAAYLDVNGVFTASQFVATQGGLTINGTGGVNANTTKIFFNNVNASTGWAISQGVNGVTQERLSFGHWDGSTYSNLVFIDNDSNIVTNNYGSASDWIAKVTNMENAIGIGFSNGNFNDAPYFYHSSGQHRFLATQEWTNNNFASNTAVNNKVDRTGDTMTGTLSINSVGQYLLLRGQTITSNYSTYQKYDDSKAIAYVGADGGSAGGGGTGDNFVIRATTDLILNSDNNRVRVSQSELWSERGLTVDQTVGNGYGISLYADTSANPDYGIMFATSSNYGGIGHNSGDWNTYFTMTGGVTRGWIFRHKVSGNVAGINGEGRISTLNDLTSNEWAYSYRNALMNRGNTFVSNTDGNALPNETTIIANEMGNGSGNTNFPINGSYGTFIRQRSNSFTTDFMNYNSGEMYFRNWYNFSPDLAAQAPWRKVIDDQNITSYVNNIVGGNYALTNGSNTIGGNWDITAVVSSSLASAVGNGQIFNTSGGVIYWGNPQLSQHTFEMATNDALRVYSAQAGTDGIVWHSLNFNPANYALLSQVPTNNNQLANGANYTTLPLVQTWIGTQGYTNTTVGANNTGFTSGQINFLGGGGISIGKSGNNITISHSGSGGGGITNIGTDDPNLPGPTSSNMPIVFNSHVAYGKPETDINDEEVGNGQIQVTSGDNMRFHHSFDNVMTFVEDAGKQVDIDTNEIRKHICNVVFTPAPGTGGTVTFTAGIYTGDQINITVPRGEPINLQPQGGINLISSAGQEVYTHANLIWDAKIDSWVLVSYE